MRDMFGGKWMDNFMDKLAQKFNAQEIIKANAQAEAQEMSKLQAQVATYDEYLKEMRKLNLKNLESADALKRMTEESFAKLNEFKVQDGNVIGQLGTLTELLEAQQKKLQEMQAEMEDFVHKEDIKVYRNVQAVMVEESKKQTQEICTEIQKQSAGNKAVLPLLIVVTLLGIGNLVLFALAQIGVF